MLTKPPWGLQFSCELVGHLQLFPVLDAAVFLLQQQPDGSSTAKCPGQGARELTPWGEEG